MRMRCVNETGNELWAIQAGYLDGMAVVLGRVGGIFVEVGVGDGDDEAAKTEAGVNVPDG